METCTYPSRYPEPCNESRWIFASLSQRSKNITPKIEMHIGIRAVRVTRLFIPNRDHFRIMYFYLGTPQRLSIPYPTSLYWNDVYLKVAT